MWSRLQIIRVVRNHLQLFICTIYFDWYNKDFLIYEYLEWDPQKRAQRQPLLYLHFLSAFQCFFLVKHQSSFSKFYHRSKHMFLELFYLRLVHWKVLYAHWLLPKGNQIISVFFCDMWTSANFSFTETLKWTYIAQTNSFKSPGLVY